ncbi:hypothetical protein [Bosea sp. (in: a-proteobacteria)]|jgi:hypothetical protein|uniref:hypothetical protein n=1 Tax=Bosea sp. (in: a-proteobacteria) TaxID=1871050 RepID=UPI003565121E
MTMRAFTPTEERALVKLGDLPGETFLDVTRDRPSIYERLSDKGLATLTLHKRQKRARLTGTGRYFAELVASKRGRP